MVPVTGSRKKRDGNSTRARHPRFAVISLALHLLVATARDESETTTRACLKLDQGCLFCPTFLSPIRHRSDLASAKARRRRCCCCISLCTSSRLIFSSPLHSPSLLSLVRSRLPALFLFCLFLQLAGPHSLSLTLLLLLLLLLNSHRHFLFYFRVRNARHVSIDCSRLTSISSLFLCFDIQTPSIFRTITLPRLRTNPPTEIDAQPPALRIRPRPFATSPTRPPRSNRAVPGLPFPPDTTARQTPTPTRIQTRT